MKFALLGILLSWFGYVSAQMMYPTLVFLLPTVPIIKLLNWDSALGFYHSGSPADRFGMVKVIFVGAIEFGFLGWCLDLIRHHKVKSEK